MISPFDWARRIATDVVLKYPNNHAEQKTVFLRLVRRHADYQRSCEKLAECGLLRLLSDVRHDFNTKIKYSSRKFDPVECKPQVKTTGTSNDLYELLYRYNYDGQVLGSMTRDDLERVRDKAEGKAEGERKNAALFGSLIDLVPEGKTVRQAVSGPDLYDMFKLAGFNPDSFYVKPTKISLTRAAVPH